MAKKQESFINHSIEELDKFVFQTKEELRGLLFSIAGSKNHNVKKASQLRRGIARALTERTKRISKNI